MLKKISSSLFNQDNDNKVVGKNKVIINFITRNVIDGTGFKLEAKLSKLIFINNLYLYVVK